MSNRRPAATSVKLNISKRHGSFGASVLHLLPLLHVRTANQSTIAAAALFTKTNRWIPLLFYPRGACVYLSKTVCALPTGRRRLDCTLPSFSQNNKRTVSHNSVRKVFLHCGLKNHRRTKNQYVVKVGEKNVPGLRSGSSTGFLSSHYYLQGLTKRKI